MTISRYGMGWLPDLPDHRDIPYAITRVSGLPPSADLRSSMPPIYDQGSTSSCTGNACAAALAYARTMQGLQDFTPSRLMLYYVARELEGNATADSGAQIRDAIKGAGQNGACPETEWPFDTSQITTKPSDNAYQAAFKDRAIGYKRVNQDMISIRSCLADGDPIVFGFSVYQSFEGDQVAQTGIMPMPSAKEGIVGGHAVLAVGYSDDNECVIVRNSWSSSWGDAGYFYMPFAYITNQNLASDFWTIRLITP